jgi:hypothetical protein
LNLTSTVTMEAWVELDNASADQKIVGKSSINRGYLLGVQSANLYPNIWDSAGDRFYFYSGSVASSQWIHLATTWSTGGSMIGYVNGVEVRSIPSGSNKIGTNTRALYIGVAPWDPNYFKVKGLVDEVRISSAVRSAHWIQTQYNNQSSPETFYTVGPKQSALGCP